MAMIPVYLTDDDGDVILGEDGVGIIVGYVEEDLYAGTSGELSTTFKSVIESATIENRRKVIEGLRLAKPIRGRLNRFHIGGEEHNAYVKYNHRIFGGRFKSEYTALGSVVGTYLRRGGTAFSKELIEAALVTGPFANFTNFPSLVLPGDVSLRVSAGGGTVEGYAWTITDGVTTFSPTVSNPTVTLTAGTWTASCDVTIDGAVISVGPQSFDATDLATSGITTSVNSPVAGQNVTYTVGANAPQFIESTDWTFKVDLTVAEIDLIEGQDYTVVSSDNDSITVRFEVTGDFIVGCTATEVGGEVQTAEAPFDVTDIPATASYTNHAYLKPGSTTCTALVKEDTHCIVIGDSIMNLLKADSFRKGMQYSWSPARWAGLQPPMTSNNAYLTGTEAAFYSCFRSNYNGNQYITNRKDEHTVTRNSGAGNIRRDGTKNFSGVAEPFMDPAAAKKKTCPASAFQFKVTASSGTEAWSTEIDNNARAATPMLGRLQTGSDAFYNTNGMLSRAIGFGVDNMTMDLSSDVSSAAASTVTFTAGSHVHMQTICDTLESTFGSNLGSLVLSLDGTESVGDRFVLLDQYVYNPNIDGLSISYLGDGGWQSANHRGGARALAKGNTTTNGGEWYDDDAIKEHLEMVVWKNSAKTVLRDNIVCMIEVQNRIGSEGHDGQARVDVVPLIERWKTQADLVSSGLGDNIKFVFLVLQDIVMGNEHEETAQMLLDVVDRTDYDFEIFNLNGAVKALGGGYTNPFNYTDQYSTPGSTGGTVTPASLITWYTLNNTGTDIDTVHPTEEGNNDLMAILWDDIIAANVVTESVNGNVTAEPTFSQSGEAIEFDVDGITGDTDRVIVWLDQDGNEVARGENPTLNNLPSTVTRVDARIITADGADVTLVGPDIQINDLPVFTDDPQLNDYDDPIVEGATIPIRVRATDAVGSTLTYRYEINNQDFGEIGSFSPGTWAEFNVVAGVGEQTLVVFVTDGKTMDEVESAPFVFTPASANTAPTISLDLNVNTAGGTETGDTLNLTCLIIADAEDPFSSLECEFFYSLDGVNYTSIGPFVNPTGVGVATTTFVPATAGDYDFRAIVTDSGGLTAQADSTASTTITDPPSDPFGTPDLVVEGTFDGNGSVNPEDWTTTTDNIGLSPAEQGQPEGKLYISVWNTGAPSVTSSPARVRLSVNRAPDRTTMNNYWSNNPNAVIVFELSNGDKIYYLTSAVSSTGALEFGTTSGFKELKSMTGWFEEDGTPVDSTGPGTAQSPGSTIKMSIYPTNLTGSGWTKVGTLPFGQNGTNTNQTDASIESFVTSLQSVPGADILHFSMPTNGVDRLFVNSRFGFDEQTAMTELASRITDNKVQFRIVTGTGTWYEARDGSPFGVPSISTENCNIEFGQWMDDTGKQIAASTVNTLLATQSSDVEIWRYD